MTHFLVCHDDSPCAAISSIGVEILCRPDGDVELIYTLTGRIPDIIVPAVMAPHRADGLWRTTCFEIFIEDSLPRYREFNFSPSGTWAAYAFDDFRRGMRPLDVASDPVILVTGGGDQLILTAKAPIEIDVGRRIGLSVIVEEKSGGKSFWALAHPQGEADFHHRDCFALKLGAPEAP